MLRCRCMACDASFLDAGGAKRCPSCGKKGKLQPLSISGGPPLEVQLADLGQRMPALAGLDVGQAMVTATVRRGPLRRAGAVTLLVASCIALLETLIYLIFLARVRIIGDWPAEVHAWGLIVCFGGVLGFIGALRSIQGAPLGRTMGLVAAGAMAGSFALLFLPDGGILFLVGVLVLPPAMWLCAIAALLLHAIPDRPIASDTTTITVAGPVG